MTYKWKRSFVSTSMESMIKFVNPFLTVIGKFPFMIENLLYVFGSRERPSKFTKEVCMPLRLTPK